jgi:DNA-binding LacI/PurR family transcriptional regulator
MMSIAEEPELNQAQGSLPAADRRRAEVGALAQMTGASELEISRALSGSPGLDAGFRASVMTLAQQHGFSVLVGAQKLHAKQNRTVTVVIPYEGAARQHLSDPFFLAILGSIADTLTDRGLDMLISRIDAENLHEAAQSFDTGRAVGVILIGQWRRQDQLNHVAARKVPLVVWGALLPGQSYVTIGTDNIEGGFLATEHLIKGGRKRIAFFGDIELPEVTKRYEGYCKALQQYGLPFDAQLVIPATFKEEGGIAAMEELNRRGVPYDALFACSDLLAMTAIGVMQAEHKRVPEDIAVVGYDDIDRARFFNPPVTTIRQSMEAAGPALVDTLLAIIDEQQVEPYLIPTQLVVRDSAR